MGKKYIFLCNVDMPGHNEFDEEILSILKDKIRDIKVLSKTTIPNVFGRSVWVVAHKWLHAIRLIHKNSLDSEEDMLLMRYFYETFKKRLFDKKFTLLVQDDKDTA